MVERRSALTIPFTMKKDNVMENPLRINIPCLSTQCGKVERQVPWTTLAGCKVKQNSPHKNGSVKFDCSRAAMTSLGTTRREPLLILTDVLKTKLGKAYMERMKGGQTGTDRPAAVGLCKTDPICNRKPKVSRTRNNGSKSVTPKGEKYTSTPSESSRCTVKRRLQSAFDQEKKDEQEVVVREDSGENDKLAEVVDCGFSVSWDQSEDKESCDELSPADIDDKVSEPEDDVQHVVKRKRKDAGSHCNGTSSPKRHRESVLRLTRDDRRDRGTAPAAARQEESAEDGDVASEDCSILQLKVRGDDQSEPISTPSVEARHIIRSPKRGKENAGEATPSKAKPSKVTPTEATPSEPIVLSSDDDEGADVVRRCRSLVQTRLVTVSDSVIQGRPSQKVLTKEPGISDLLDMGVLRVVVPDSPHITPPTSVEEDYTKIDVAFTALHCGGYRGTSNGNMMIVKDKIHIPLKDATKQQEVMLSFDKKALKRYSVWEPDKLEAEELCFRDGDDPHQDALLFFVSETAAAAVHGALSTLDYTVKASPFILFTLEEPLTGVKGALLRSTLDIECLNSMSQEQAEMSPDLVSNGGLEDFLSPVLSLEESISLMEKIQADADVLSLLGVKSTGPEPNVGQDSLHSDQDDDSPALIKPGILLQKKSLLLESLPVIKLQTSPELRRETLPVLETSPEQEEATQHKPKQDEAQVDPEQSTEKKEKPAPVYTLCHRRTKASYSVSLCKPDSKWIKYKHLGLARRLIQFPPPPLKGGITVTLEDLQCLDSGQYLNDVIIDFYLKYLMQNAPASIAERSHVFSSFFYKQLTRRDNASEGGSNESCQRQRRHQRVKTWTRHVDIFQKDFLFVPVNQEAHWYLVVICFPGLDEPKYEEWTCPTSAGGTVEEQDQEEVLACKSSNEVEDTSPSLNSSNATEMQTEKAEDESTKDLFLGLVNFTELTCKKTTVCKRPCILIMDSLKVSLHERVFKLLRDYLQSEWEVRRGSSRDFGPDQMKSSHCKVPLQDNSSDCGLYLLQYVECFLKDPVVHFELPLCLERWFPRQQIRRKRDDIRDLILYLYRLQNSSNSHMELPCC